MRWVRVLGAAIATVGAIVSLAVLIAGSGWAGVPALIGAGVFAACCRHPVVKPIGRRQTVLGATALAAGLALTTLFAAATGGHPPPLPMLLLAVAAAGLAVHARRVSKRIRRPAYVNYLSE